MNPISKNEGIPSDNQPFLLKGIDSLYLQISDVFQEIYSKKGLLAAEKMAKQLEFARTDPHGKDKPISGAFTVDLSYAGPLAPLEERLSSVVAQHQGARPYQEDGYLVGDDMPRAKVHFTWQGVQKEGLLFGVMDGHGDGGKVSLFLNEHLLKALGRLLTRASSDYSELDDEVVCNALATVFKGMSMAYRKSYGEGGATVCCLFQMDDRLYFPNIGDSRAILIKKSGAEQLTEDGLVSKTRFQKWHLKAKNRLFSIDRIIRVTSGFGDQPLLNLGRDVGAHYWMCSRPKITNVKMLYGNQEGNLQKGGLFCEPGDLIALFTDGMSDVANNAELGNAINALDEAGVPLQEIANRLAERAGTFDGFTDNVTVMLIRV